jgi:hypothetical protein
MKRGVTYYYERMRDLGPRGTLNRIRAKSKNVLTIWSQSFWWGVKASHKMTDYDLLAKTTGEWNSIEDLLDHLANRPAMSFILPHQSPQDTTKLLESYYPAYLPKLLKKANSACQGELDLLGHDYKFNKRIDWNCDPVTGWHWPSWHRSRISGYLYSASIPIDPIVTWELNRHQHFITLGIAYWLTNDQKYINALITQMKMWIDTNPVQHGINWYYPLEVSIRLLAWIVAFQFIRNSKEFQQEIGKEFIKSIWQQVDFVNNHLQITRSDYPNNHMIAELTCLILVGITFPEFKSALKWRDISLGLLNHQATIQTHLDGVNKEQATGYHRFVTELLLLVVSRTRQNGLKLESKLEIILEEMLDYILYSISPNGMSPMWGDSDYGCALGMGINKPFQDFRPLLSTGAVMFTRADWKFAAGRFDEESFWLLGSSGLENWNKLDFCEPEKISKDFRQAGLYVIRDKWATTTDLAMFRCGSFGLGGDGRCAHAHADILSFTLWLTGKPVLIDSGTYIYHGPWRDFFRSTAAHNTVMIDDHEQAIPVPNFNWRGVPEASCIKWTGNCVSGMMDYYGEVNLVRTLSHPQPGNWELIETFTGDCSKHKITWFFHLAEGLTCYLDDSNHVIIMDENKIPFVKLFAPYDVDLKVTSTWSSNSYYEKQLTSVIQAIWGRGILSNNQKFCWKFLKI